MPSDPAQLAVVLTIFLVAGFVKGIVGLGLPVLSVGLLSLVLPPAQAVALITMPSIATNVWQLAVGPHLSYLVRRLRVYLLVNFLATLAGLWTGFLAGDHGGAALATVGLGLAAYGVVGLSPVPLSVSPATERWLGPVVAAMTGAIASVTGVLSVPSVPYLEAIGLRRDALVQGLGLSFTVTTVGLILGLAYHGIFRVSLASVSMVALIPSLIGMAAGQWVRGRIHPRRFRQFFLVGLIGLGAHLLLRAWS